ncbi:uncharacterized protein LOC116262891 [Nymphaea colorata]|nr:uncharacterized protein LOC116262891 [Nymphaea colorata]
MAAAIGGRVMMAARSAHINPDRRCFLSRRWPDSSNQGHLAASFSSNGSSKPQRKLVLYTKPGCCLCEGLKEKLDLVLKLGAPDSLDDVELQTRDILSNPEWERRYQYEIPVLARVLPDGTEENLPRLSPRLGVEMIKKKLVAALQ